MRLTIKRTGVLLLLTGIWGCWEQPSHELDTDGGMVDDDTMSGAGDSLDSGTEADTRSDTTADTQSDTSIEPRNSLLATAWAGFGTGCTDVSECSGYPAVEKRCLQNVMGIVNCPGGYCTACCNVPGEGVCGQGIDCVGVTNAYLICLERCETDDDCRTEDHYVCHEGLYYMETIFAGKYCLPDSEHATPDPSVTQETICPWPWR